MVILCITRCSNIVIPLSINVEKVGLIVHVCVGLLYAWYVQGTVVGRHAETGVTLSANHVYPVGGVTLVVHH